jgi:hypothetical protein
MGVQTDFRNISSRFKWWLTATAVEMRMEHLGRVLGQKFNPGQPRVPAGQPDGGQWTNEGATFQLVASGRISPAKEAECEAQLIRDEFQCRMVGLRACWTQAYFRYGNCLAGLPIPPLNY